MERINCFFILFLFLSGLIVRGGVYSFFYYFLFLALLFIYLYSFFHYCIKYKIYKVKITNVDLAFLIFIIYSIFLSIFVSLYKPYNISIIDEFNYLWNKIGYFSDKNSNNYNININSILSILTIVSSYLWFKITLKIKDLDYVYKKLFYLYNFTCIIFIFNIKFDNFSNVFGIFLNSVHLASFISIAMPIIYFYLFYKKTKLNSLFILKILYFLSLFVILFYLKKRMAIFSVSIVFIIYLFLLNYKKRFKILLIFFTVSIFLFLNYYNLVVRANNLTDNNNFSNLINFTQRKDIIFNSFKIIKDNILIGVGGGNFKLLYPFYSSRDYFFVHHAHNEYLQFVVEYGLLGSFILFWILFSLFKLIIFGLKNLSKKNKALFIANLFSLLIFQIQILSDFQLHIGVLLLVYIFFIASLYLIVDKEFKGKFISTKIIRFSSFKCKFFDFSFVFILLLNISIYSYIFLLDFKYSKDLNYPYKNIIGIESKKILNKDKKDMKIKDFLDLVNLEKNNIYTYFSFLDYLFSLNIDNELKNNVIIQNLDIFEKFKESFIFTDLRIYIYILWKEDRENIKKLINKSLKLERRISFHKLFLKDIFMKEYSNYLINNYIPRNYIEKKDYWYYLIKTDNYNKIIAFLENDDLYISKNLKNFYLSKYYYLNKKEEKLKKMVIYKKNYNYFFLAKFYYDKKNFIKARIILEKMKKITNDKSEYSTLLAKTYYKLNEPKKALEVFLELNSEILNKFYYVYVLIAKKLDCRERIKYLERIKYIVKNKIIYKELIHCYKKIGDKYKENYYKIKIK